MAGTASNEGSTGFWASLTSSGTSYSGPSGGGAVPNSLGNVHGMGGGLSASGSFQGGANSRWAGGTAQLAPGGSIGSMGLFALAGSPEDDDSEELLVLDGSTGLPALAASAALAPNSKGGLSLVVTTADGRVGSAPLRPDGRLPLVVVDDPALLAESNPSRRLDPGAVVVEIETRTLR